MNIDLFGYLENHSLDTHEINRLVVSLFLDSHGIDRIKNVLINGFLIKKGHLDYKRFQEFKAHFKIDSLEELIEIFEYVISPEDKVITGAVYTPLHIREYIIENCISKFSNVKNIKVCDPAVGCAGFLVSAARKIKRVYGSSFRSIFERQIFGLDIQGYAVARSEILLTLLAISEGEDERTFKFNIFVGNALEFKWSEVKKCANGFEIIVGNPPYVCSRNIEPDTKKLLANWDVCSTGHPDLYIPFFQLGLEALAPGGILGFITMSTFFKSLNGRALRGYLSNQKLDISIIDFGSHQIFDSKSTYTCLCFISNKESNHLKYKKINDGSLTSKKSFQRIRRQNLNDHSGWNLNQSAVINKIESIGIPFGKSYRTSSGIATLKNSVYIFDPVKEDEDYYYLDSGKVFPIEKAACKDIINANKLTKVSKISSIVQKAIFPYDYDANNTAVIINEEDFKSRYPKTYIYLKTQKNILSKRDKGKGTYVSWYAYGRNQSLERFRVKLFFPHICSTSPCFVISKNRDLLFYNGLAVTSDDAHEMKFLSKIMGSKLFWFYIQNSSRPYGAGYYSLSRNYIKNFGICAFSEEEKQLIIESDAQQLQDFLRNKYRFDIS